MTLPHWHQWPELSGGPFTSSYFSHPLIVHHYEELHSCAESLSCVQLFETPGAVAHLSVGFPRHIPRQKYPSALPVPSPAFLLLLFSCSVVSNSLQPHGLKHARLPCPSPSPETYSSSCPSSQWCHPPISSSVIPFSSCLLSFPASAFFLPIWKNPCQFISVAQFTY